MHVIEVLLPLYKGSGEAVGDDAFSQTRAELVDRFGGVTVHASTPTEGLWLDTDGTPMHNEMIVYEVLAEPLERSWWRVYRRLLEYRFDHPMIMVRSNSMPLN